MSEKPHDHEDQDPAPTKESDANRVTSEESEGASRDQGAPAETEAKDDE